MMCYTELSLINGNIKSFYCLLGMLMSAFISGWTNVDYFLYRFYLILVHPHCASCKLILTRLDHHRDNTACSVAESTDGSEWRDRCRRFSVNKPSR